MCFASRDETSCAVDVSCCIHVGGSAVSNRRITRPNPSPVLSLGSFWGHVKRFVFDSLLWRNLFSVAAVIPFALCIVPPTSPNRTVGQVLMGSSLWDVLTSLDLCKTIVYRVRLNYFWALLWVRRLFLGSKLFCLVVFTWTSIRLPEPQSIVVIVFPAALNAW